MKKSSISRVAAFFVSAAMMVSFQTPLLSELDIFAPPMAVYADSLGVGDGITIGGASYTLPTEMDTPLDIPNTESDGIDAGFVHTLTKTTDGYTLTLNGGAINADNSALSVGLAENESLTINVVADTTISSSSSENSAIDVSGSTPSSLKLIGSATLTVEGGTSSISAPAIIMDEFCGKLIMSSDYVTDNLFACGDVTIPYGFRYRTSADDEYYVRDVALFPDNDNTYFEYVFSPIAIWFPGIITEWGEIQFVDVCVYRFTLNSTFSNDVTEWFGGSLPEGVTANGEVDGKDHLMVSFSPSLPIEYFDSLSFTIPDTYTSIGEAAQVCSVYKGNVALTDYSGLPYYINCPSYCTLDTLSEMTVAWLTLKDTTFKTSLPQESDVSSWFTNIPAGINARLKSNISEGDDTAEIQFSGMPTGYCDESINVSIPAEVIADGGKAVYFPIPDSRWFITGLITISSIPTIENDERFDLLPTSFSEEYKRRVEGCVRDIGEYDKHYIFGRSEDGYHSYYLDYGDNVQEEILTGKKGNETYFFAFEMDKLPDGDDIVIGGASYGFPTVTNIDYIIPNTVSDGIQDCYTHTLTKTDSNAYTLTLHGGEISDTATEAALRVSDSRVVLTIDIVDYTVFKCSNANNLIVGSFIAIKSDNYSEIVLEMCNQNADALSAEVLDIYSGSVAVYGASGNGCPLKVESLNIYADTYRCIYDNGIVYYPGDDSTPFNNGDSKGSFSLVINCDRFVQISGGAPIYGIPNRDIATQQYEVKLYGDMFNGCVNLDSDLYEWLNPYDNHEYPTGITARITDTAPDRTWAMIEVYGNTPVDTFGDYYLTLTIPGDMLESGMNMYAPASPEMIVNISGDNNLGEIRSEYESGVEIIGKYGFELETHYEFSLDLIYDSFIDIEHGTDVTSWFEGIPNGLDVFLKGNVESAAKTATFIITGTPREAIGCELKIVIPGEFLESNLTLRSIHADGKADYYSIYNPSVMSENAITDDQRYESLDEYTYYLESVMIETVSHFNHDNRYFFAQLDETFYYFEYNSESNRFTVNTTTSRDGGESIYFMDWGIPLSYGEELYIDGIGYSLPYVMSGFQFTIPVSDRMNGLTASHTLEAIENESGLNILFTLNGGTIDNTSSLASPTIEFCDSQYINYYVTVKVAENTNILGDTVGIKSSKRIGFIGSKCLNVSAEEKGIEGASFFDLSKFYGKLIMNTQDSASSPLALSDNGRLITRDGTRYRTSADGAYLTDSYTFDDGNYLEFDLTFHLNGATITVGESFKVNVYYDYMQFSMGNLYSNPTGAMLEYRLYGTEDITSMALDMTSDKCEVTGFAAKNLGDKIQLRVRISGVCDNEDYVGEWVTFSVESYLKALLNDESQSLETRRLCADILNYGAAAQTYFGYNTDALVNSGIDLSTATSDTTPLPQVADYADDNMGADSEKYYGSSLILLDTVVIRHYFVALDTVANCSGTKTINDAPAYYYDTVVTSPREFDNKSTANCDGNEVNLSVNYYIARIIASSSRSNELKSLVSMLYYFGLSAEAYAG